MNGWKLLNRLTAFPILAAGLVLLTTAQPARAEEGASSWVRGEAAAVRLVAAATGTAGLETIRLGLEFDLEPGWKTYWRSPGDAGLPPRLQWMRRDNLAEAVMRWPAPKRFTLFGIDTFGYTDHVVFPIDARLVRPGEALRLEARVEYLVCEEVCIPGTADLALALPAGPAEPSDFANLIDRYRARIPGDGAAAGLGFERAVLIGDSERPVLAAAFSAATPFAAPDLLIEGPEGVVFGPPEFAFDAGKYRLQVRVPVEDAAGLGAPPDIAGQELRLTLIDGERAMEIRASPQLGVLPGLASPTAGGLLVVLALALLGGLILNLMPCVLPVLSIKLLGVIELGGAGRGTVRLSFLATSAGILASFLVLAAAATAGKAAGLAVGWGIQFQQPAFLVAMVLILTLFACNLWGLFDIALPSALADAAVRGGTRRGRAYRGSFLTGAFVTLLATPCSAPFLGTAVGFALSREAGEIFAVFTALGLGLALPYLLVAAFPVLATALPRPGKWMITLKRVLSVALAAAAVWLLSVLATQVSVPAALIVGGLMVLLAAVFVVRRRTEGGKRLVPAAVAAVALTAFATPAVLPVAEVAPSVGVRTARILWQPFDQAAISRLVAEGKTVLVDVTADWCITCQVNKALVLRDERVWRVLNGPDFVAMKADWTRPDDEIAAYLASFGRYGIPFDVVYGPDRPQGVVLPELLSRGAVFAAVDAAGGADALAVR